MPYQTATLMRGPERIREIAETYLSGAVPQLLVSARTQWNLPAYMLPDPVEYRVYDPMGVKEYPVMGLFINNTRQFPHTDYGEAMEDEYWIRYACRFYVWAKTPSNDTGGVVKPAFDNVVKVRDNLGTILRAAALARQSFGFPDEFRIVEETIAEDYLEPVRINEQSPYWLAGYVMSLDVEHKELIYRLPVSEADTVTLDVGLLPRGE